MSEAAFKLTGKQILITGATGGIGSAIVQMVVGLGASCHITGRDESKLQGQKSRFGHSVETYTHDLMNSEELESMVGRLPRLDGVVHAAGVVQPFPIKFLNPAKLNDTFGLNFGVPLELTRLLLKKKMMNNGASHVFLSSISGDHPHMGGAAYAGSKAALQAFSKTLALETAHLAMRSNCVCPAMVKTEMYDQAEKGMSREKMEEHVGKYPLGVGDPTDVANSVVFLLSDASRWITGINLTLDGGFLLNAK